MPIKTGGMGKALAQGDGLLAAAWKIGQILSYRVINTYKSLIHKLGKQKSGIELGDGCNFGGFFQGKLSSQVLSKCAMKQDGSILGYKHIKGLPA